MPFSAVCSGSVSATRHGPVGPVGSSAWEDRWQVTCDRWQVTGDRWQVTGERWQGHLVCHSQQLLQGLVKLGTIDWLVLSERLKRCSPILHSSAPKARQSLPPCFLLMLPPQWLISCVSKAHQQNPLNPGIYHYFHFPTSTMWIRSKRPLGDCSWREGCGRW